MQAVTALAHLKAAVVYVFDPSEQCGYNVAQQIKLFESIRPLFANKPLMIAANKCDVIRLDAVSEENKELLSSLKDVPMFEMSTVTEEGVMDVKHEACEKLLQYRVTMKVCICTVKVLGSLVIPWGLIAVVSYFHSYHCTLTIL